MFHQHCNKCFRQRDLELTLQLYTSTCGHILCKECAKSTCAICTRPFKAIIIAKGMPTSMTAYFEDPIKIYQRFQKVTKYQQDQWANLAHYQVNMLPQRLRKTQQQFDGIVKLKTRLSADLESEKKRIEKLQTYLAYHERKLERPNDLEPPKPAPVRNRYGSETGDTPTNILPSVACSQRYRPNTPTLSLPDSNSVEDDDDEGHANVSELGQNCDFNM